MKTRSTWTLTRQLIIRFWLQMYGRYTKDLGEYAKDEARRLKQLERQRKKDDRARDKVNDKTNWFSRSILMQIRSIEYKAAVVGISRSFSVSVAKEKSSRLSLGAGATRLQGWVKIGYS